MPTQAEISPQNQIKVVLLSGLGGAILGLSTLSFYDEPQDHLRNIALGGAVALIVSCIYNRAFS